MTEDRKKRIYEALESYTQKMTASPAIAKQALENEGIYQADGELTPQYQEPVNAD